MITIGIDGPSAAGKSATAKAISKRLNILHLNTGALYRAIAVYLLDNNVDISNEKAVNKVLPKISITVDFVKGEQRTVLNGTDITDRLYSSEASKAASISSSYKNIRKKMKSLQQNIAKQHSVIMEGRDITSVVLPNAKYKFFLTASPETRAKRRLQNLLDAGEKIEYEQVLQDILERDDRDSNRENNPLVLVDDAILIETDSYTLDEVVDLICSYIKEDK